MEAGEAPPADDGDEIVAVRCSSSFIPSPSTTIPVPFATSTTALAHGAQNLTPWCRTFMRGPFAGCVRAIRYTHPGDHVANRGAGRRRSRERRTSSHTTRIPRRAIRGSAPRSPSPHTRAPATFHVHRLSHCVCGVRRTVLCAEPACWVSRAGWQADNGPCG